MTRTALLLAAAAAVLMLPSLVMGTLPSHSSMHNLTWAAQFAEQLRAGIPYPRWMAQSFEGLGAPSFYFYPPLPFWLDALVSLVTFDVLPTSYRLSLSSALLLWISGLSFFAWLRLQKADAQTALIGAIAYMAAPYHLVDHYIRGAFAEFAAYTTMPFVFCALALIARRHRYGGPALAVSYAALVTSHLPTALLISLTAVSAYVLYVAWRERAKDRWFLARCAVGFALGLALAALYLLPALSLQDATLISWLWTWGFRIEQSYLLMPWRWVQESELFVMVSSIAGASLLALLALAAFGQVRRDPASYASLIMWATIAIGSVILMSGLVPWQSLPLVSQVGFAWRLLIVVEFATITALCLAPWPARTRAVTRMLWLAAIALAPALSVMSRDVVNRIEIMREGATMRLQDAREYLPAGYPQHPGAAYEEIGLELIKDVPLIACEPAPRHCRAEPGRFGDLRIAVDSAQPTGVTLGRFAFPAWQLDPPLPLVATEPLRLVSFTAPAGAHAWTLRRRPLPQETRGGLISAAALLVLVGWFAAARLRARRLSA